MLLTAVLLLPSGAKAQSWKYVDVVRYADLEFGVVGQNDGEVFKARTDPYVAKFKVSAKLPGAPGARPSVHLYFEPPPRLDGDEGQGASIPYVMRAAYNAYEDDPYTATEISGTSATIDLGIPEGRDGPGPPVYSAFVYVYGYVTIGSQPAGPYLGELALTVEERYPGGWAENDGGGDDMDGDDDGDRHKNDEGAGHTKGKGSGHDDDHE